MTDKHFFFYFKIIQILISANNYRYEESAKRIIELENRDDESHNKLVALESDLKRTRDRLVESQVFFFFI